MDKLPMLFHGRNRSIGGRCIRAEQSGIKSKEKKTCKIFKEERYMQKYFIETELIPYVMRILTRGFRSYSVDRSATAEEGFTAIYAEADEDVFEKIRMRAKCERRTSQTGVLYMTEEEWRTGMMRADLFRPFGMPAKKSRACCILERNPEGGLE